MSLLLAPGHRDTPILAMTANAFGMERAFFLEAGMNDPFDSDTLFLTLLKTSAVDLSI